MILSYDILTQLSIKHQFFGSNLLNNVEWVPSSQSLSLAKNLGLFFKSNNGVLSILVNTELNDSKKVLDFRLQDDFSLTFYIKNNEQYWSNLTPVDIAKDETLFFSNEIINKENSNFYLQNKAEVSVADSIKYISDVNKLSLKNLDPNSAKLSQIKSSKELLEYGLKSNNDELRLNDKLLDEGLYEIEDKEGNILSFFLLKDKSPLDGVCHLIFSPEWGGEYNIINSDWTWNSMTLELNFPTRETYWRYFFPKENLTLFEGVTILSEDGKPAFNQGDEVNVYGSKAMICYTSIEPIKLKQKMDVYFQLKKNVGIENRTEGIIINKLPTAAKEMLYRVDEKGNRYSDIYINF